MPYATAQDLLDRYDSRRIGDLATDSGTRLTEAQILSDSKVSACIEDASGTFMVAVNRGNRYSEEDLMLLSGSSANFLKRVICDLAFAYLVMRRGYGNDEVAAQAPGYRSAQDALKQISEGELVFESAKHMNAGNPSFTKNTYTVAGFGQLPSSTAQRLFGVR